MPFRPQIPTSTDGEPLAVNVLDLFPFEFPYDRLPSETSPIIAALMRPEVCILLCLAYLGSKPVLRVVAKWVNPKSTIFVSCVAFHNLALTVFSAIVFVNSWPVVLIHLRERGMEATYCDQDGSLWGSAGLGGWATIFYISKYYEFVDTWVLILKGKKPSFLQVYHHIGITIFMWSGVASQSAWLLIVVLLNSGIHTLMYTYFFIKTLFPRMEIPMARYLTRAQIIQFLAGIIYTTGIHFLGDSCDSLASRFAAACIQVYAVGLTFLFVAFSAKKYKKK